MSRRKQLRPHHIHTEDASFSPRCRPAAVLCSHVCSRCCAEFSSPSDLKQHRADCSPNPPVLIGSELEDLLSGRRTFPASSLRSSPAENRNIQSQDRSSTNAAFMDRFSIRSSHRSVESSGSSCSNQSIRGPECKTDAVLCSSSQPGCSADPQGDSWSRTKVSQPSQLMFSDSGETSISSLLQQLLTLQIQQIHQLQLIDHIRHQVLLFASHQSEIPETLVICTKDLSPSESTSQLRALSAHLSQCLSAQSDHRTVFKQPNQREPDDELSAFSQTFSKLVPTAAHKHGVRGSPSPDSHLNLSSSMFNFIGKTCEAAAGSEHSDIRAIVEDLDALAALAEQRKCKNLKLSASALSSKERLFKQKCRFCTKVFEKDSALQIHLRSHTGERPYKCNVCGNRFSTRGNLKVHLQRHQERYPHIQMNPHHVPEHKDKIQTNAGIPVGASLSPEEAASRWFDSSSFPNIMTSDSLEELDSTNMSSLIKKEETLISAPTALAQSDLYMDFRSEANTSDSVETRKLRAMNLKSEDVKPPFNFNTLTSNPEESVRFIPDLFTHPCSTSLSGFLSLKHSDDPELQLLSDPNECVICHRRLSCQSALRMHHRTHTGERPYQCELCGRAFTTKGNLKTHRAVHRVREQSSCSVCQRRFTDAVVSQQHVNMENLSSTRLNHLPGDNDGDRHDNRSSRFKSLSIHLSPKALIDVNKRTRSQGPREELQLKRIKTERPEGSEEECSQTNNQPAAGDQQTHTTILHKESLSLNSHDPMCLKTARLNEPLQTWLNSTTVALHEPAAEPFNDSAGSILREKNNLCDVCGKSFACQSALDIHYRSHTKERPFICTTCSRSFSTKGNLRQHVLTHQMRDFPPHLFEPSMLSTSSHAVKTETAALLSSSFRNGEDVTGRSQTSSAAAFRRTNKQHQCKTCGKSFSSSSALQIHERTHTGERPFACAVCGRAFTTKGNLKVHMGTHMWNSAPSRRGCRLSVDRPSVGSWTRPVKLPEPPQKSPALVCDIREGEGEGEGTSSPCRHLPQ